jgi:outer membrane protein assembly factor BamD (BamD/ComL family)
MSRYVAAHAGDGAAHAEMARIMVQAGDEVGAKASYLKACELSLAAQDRGQCEDIYAEALRGFPDFVLSREQQLDLAYGLERNLKYEMALKAYENFAGNFPMHPEAPFALLRAANLHWKTFANPGLAKRRYQELVQRYPQDAWVDFAREQLRVLA